MPDLARLWLDAVRRGADGVTVSGGEPLAQPEGLAALLGALTAVRDELTGDGPLAVSEPRRELDILMYTGYEPEEFSDAQWRAIQAADVLITGRFDAARPTKLIWRGSANQRMLLCTPLGRRRYAAMRDHQPDKAPMQASVGPDGFWLIGVPRVGDLRRLDTGLRRHGIRASSATWRGGSRSANLATASSPSPPSPASATSQHPAPRSPTTPPTLSNPPPPDAPATAMTRPPTSTSTQLEDPAAGC